MPTFDSLLEKLIGFAFGVLVVSPIAQFVVGYAGPGGFLIAAADDLLLAFLKTSLSTWEGFNLNVFALESEKIVHEAQVYSEEDDRERAARHAAIVRWHGSGPYLFGDVSYADLGRLAYSGYTVYRSPLVGTISEWVSSGWEIAMEAVEVAPLA